MSAPRIIAGSARGIRLRPVPGDSTRPVTDRVKEALFNIIGADITGSTWLDLFSGTGSIAIEALSRGASFARLIDLNRQAVTTIRKNLEITQLIEKAHVLQADAFSFIASPPDQKFDYIYIAPPQYKALWLRALVAVDQNPDWLTPDAWVIVQIDPVEQQPYSVNNLVIFDQRRYGSTLLIFFQKT